MPRSVSDPAGGFVGRGPGAPGSSNPPSVDTRSIEVLLDEIRRYLAAVEVFRAEGHEPRWARTVPAL